MDVRAIRHHPRFDPPRSGRIKPAAARARARQLLRRGMWRAAGGDPQEYERAMSWYLAEW